MKKETITPALAERWLQNTEIQNRNIREVRVKTMARDGWVPIGAKG